MNGKAHSALARYTLRAGEWEMSDQQGAVPLEKGHRAAKLHRSGKRRKAETAAVSKHWLPGGQREQQGQVVLDGSALRRRPEGERRRL